MAVSNWLRFALFSHRQLHTLRIDWLLTTGYCSRATDHSPLVTIPSHFVWHFLDERVARGACCSVNPGWSWQRYESSSFRQPLLPGFSARLARPANQATWFLRVIAHTRRAPHFRPGDARVCFSHRIDKDHLHDPDILTLRQDCPTLACVSGKWFHLDGMSAVVVGSSCRNQPHQYFPSRVTIASGNVLAKSSTMTVGISG